MNVHQLRKVIHTAAVSRGVINRAHLRFVEFFHGHLHVLNHRDGVARFFPCLNASSHSLKNKTAKLHHLTCAVILLGLTGLSCQTAYYETMEKFGYHKRDLLVRDVEKARDAQQDAKEQFKSALDRFTKTLNIEGGELQEKYETLNAEYERSEAKAKAVRNRIASVEDVSEALFAEWNDELKQYSSSALRKKSQEQLTQTRTHYGQLIKAMKRAEAKMDPVLAKFKDQVLFLKHNLNAQAIASLKGELLSVEGNINALIKDLNASIQEADSFIAAMPKNNG